jgi:hypothetical protein
MRPTRPFTALLALLLTTGGTGAAAAQARAGAGEWVSYRDAYRTMVVFEKYGGPKDLLQNQLEVQAREPGASLDGVRLVLAGKTVQLNLPLDPLGRILFPLQKAAYDENAALLLNRKGLPFAVREQVTIAPRTDGLYDTAELRAACAQALAFARYVDASQRGRQCVGVRFVFPKKADVGARLRRADGSEQPLAVGSGVAFAGDADEDFPVLDYRFGSGGGHGQVMFYQVPLAIVPEFE